MDDQQQDSGQKYLALIAAGSLRIQNVSGNNGPNPPYQFPITVTGYCSHPNIRINGYIVNPANPTQFCSANDPNTDGDLYWRLIFNNRGTIPAGPISVLLLVEMVSGTISASDSRILQII